MQDPGYLEYIKPGKSKSRYAFGTAAFYDFNGLDNKQSAIGHQSQSEYDPDYFFHENSSKNLTAGKILYHIAVKNSMLDLPVKVN